MRYTGDVEDRYGHHISYLRVSITDRCNERCHYCMPTEEQEWLARDEVLTYEEMLRLIRITVDLGVRKIRITGGEPLTRRDVIWFMEQLGQVPGLTDIGLSTNGTLLARPVGEGGLTHAERLRQAGVRTVNVSLDTLDRATYQRVTGRDFFTLVMDGLEAAKAAGFEQIKLNCVLMRHQNEHEIWDLVRFAETHGHLLRFIELMPVSTTDVLSEENFFPIAEARRLIEYQFGTLEPAPDFRTNGPATYYRLGSGQTIGFIGAMTNLHFCETCNKLRLTCEGRLRPCLGSHLEHDLLGPLRAGASDEELRHHILEVVDKKPREHDFRGAYQPGRRMIAIGG